MRRPLRHSPFRFVLAILAASVFVRATETGPREIPVPPITTPMGTLPGVAGLPAHPTLPDVLLMNDGTRVTTPVRWPKRRAEILRTLEYYAVGQAPPAPGNVRGREVKSQTLADGKFTYRLVHLTFGSDERLGFDIGIFTPSTGGPFPTVIAPSGTPPGATPLPRLPNGPTQGKGVNVLLVVGGGTNSTAAEIPGAGRGPPDTERIAVTNAALAHGYAYVVFNHNDCGEDTTCATPMAAGRFATRASFPPIPATTGACCAAGRGAFRASSTISRPIPSLIARN